MRWGMLEKPVSPDQGRGRTVWTGSCLGFSPLGYSNTCGVLKKGRDRIGVRNRRKCSGWSRPGARYCGCTNRTGPDGASYAGTRGDGCSGRGQPGTGRLPGEWSPGGRHSDGARQDSARCGKSPWGTSSEDRPTVSYEPFEGPESRTCAESEDLRRSLMPEMGGAEIPKARQGVVARRALGAGVITDVVGEKGLDQPTLTPREASHGRGSIFFVPFCHTSKCRCGPVLWPRLPTSAISSPHLTFWPSRTENEFMWP